MVHGSSVSALAAKADQSATIREKAEEAKARAKSAASKPSAKTVEKDSKMIAKGNAIRKK